MKRQRRLGLLRPEARDGVLLDRWRRIDGRASERILADRVDRHVETRRLGELLQRTLGLPSADDGHQIRGLPMLVDEPPSVRCVRSTLVNDSPRSSTTMAMVRRTEGAAGAASGCSAGTAPADVGVRDSARDCVGRTNATASMLHLAVLAQLKSSAVKPGTA
jgi:hypothetical protein